MSDKYLIVKAKDPYLKFPRSPGCGDLVCCSSAAPFLETPKDDFALDLESKQVLPLAVICPNPWTALDKLRIDASVIQCEYTCPYTQYKHYGLLPVALISDNIEQYKLWPSHKQGVSSAMQDYWFDHEFHKSMHKESRFELNKIGTLLLGSGYTSMTSINDGSSGIQQTKVNLSNGDYLWVHFYEWYNK